LVIFLNVRIIDFSKRRYKMYESENEINKYKKENGVKKI